MGALKEYTRTAVKRSNEVRVRNAEATRICRKFEKWCKDRKGKLLLWTAKHNHDLKAPQLVRIIEIYDNHAVLEKVTFSIDGTENHIRYSVSYCSMYCGLDTFSLLEDFKL